MMTEQEKSKAINSALAQLHKKYGKDSVIQMDKEINIEVEVIPTGCFALDEAFGCGGLPRGRIIELFGQESSGKSTLATFFMAQIQKAGGKVALIDAEFAFDANYAKAIGLDTTKLILSQPGSLEEAMDVLNGLVKSNAVDIAVVDSVAALVPKAEVEGEEMLKDTMALQARLMGKALRILTGSIARSRTVVIFINQIREKVGVFYGKKETTPGGKALKFFSSVRIDVKKGERIEGKNKELIGHTLMTTMVKNKVGYPWRQATFDLYFGSGIDLVADAFDCAVAKNIIQKTGNTYSFGDLKLGVGREQGIKYLKEHENSYTGLVELLKKSKIGV
jgi:recombination protein RecA